MAHVKASIGKAAYPTTIQAGRHTLTADEPTTSGGQDSGRRDPDDLDAEPFLTVS